MDISSWRRFTRHPLSAIFPDMSEVEFESLLADMKQHGYDQKQQVWLYEGKVIDGWHRQRAGVMLDKMPTYDTFKGTPEEAEAFVIRRNLTRRHLDVSQRGLIGGRLSHLKHGGDRKTVDQDANLHLQKIADSLEISRRTAASGSKVVKNGSEELQHAVEDRIVSIYDAAAIADKPKAQQRKAVEAVANGHARTAREALGISPRINNEKPPHVHDRPSGAFICPSCKGKGWLAKEVRGELFDAVVNITGSDPKVSGSHVSKVVKLLLQAEPAYTPEDVLRLPAEFKKAGWKTSRVTVGMVEKYIGWVRNECQGSGLFDGIKEFLRRHTS